jgi:hypothetical protein
MAWRGGWEGRSPPATRSGRRPPTGADGAVVRASRLAIDKDGVPGSPFVTVVVLPGGRAAGPATEGKRASIGCARIRWARGAGARD